MCLVVVYLVYKIAMTGRRDYGMPVKRRLRCKRLRVDRDQSAQVPFWWTERQVRQVMNAHWRHTLRLPLESASKGESPGASLSNNGVMSLVLRQH